MSLSGAFGEGERWGDFLSPGFGTPQDSSQGRGDTSRGSTEHSRALVTDRTIASKIQQVEWSGYSVDTDQKVIADFSLLPYGNQDVSQKH